MADNNNKQKQSDSDTQVNPMKAVKTTSLPTKHEFASVESHKKSEKRSGNK